MTSYNTVNRNPTPHARLFVAHGAKAGAIQAQTGLPLLLPEVTYVDWAEWERASGQGPHARIDVPQSKPHFAG
ncbi:MAG: hypothetical protein RLZZ369_259 [Pseudomonadota bacterium]|jgi:hypothetical protein